MSYNSAVIMLIISNHPCALCSSDLKSLADESRNCTPLSPITMTSNSTYYNNSNHNYIKILESDWSSVGLISAVIVQLHTSCACYWTVVRVMPE